MNTLDELAKLIFIVWGLIKFFELGWWLLCSTVEKIKDKNEKSDNLK